MMGIPTPPQMDGRSWLPVAQGNAPKDWRTEVLIEVCLKTNEQTKKLALLRSKLSVLSLSLSLSLSLLCKVQRAAL